MDTSSTQLGEHRNFGLHAEECSHSGDRKLRFLLDPRPLVGKGPIRSLP